MTTNRFYYLSCSSETSFYDTKEDAHHMGILHAMGNNIPFSITEYAFPRCKNKGCKHYGEYLIHETEDGDWYECESSECDEHEDLNVGSMDKFLHKLEMNTEFYQVTAMRISKPKYDNLVEEEIKENNRRELVKPENDGIPF